MVARMSRREIENEMAFEKQIQQDVNYVATEEETGEENWTEYLEKKVAKEQAERQIEYENIMDEFVADILALD